MSVVRLARQDAGGVRVRLPRGHPQRAALERRIPTGPLPSPRVKLGGLLPDGSIPGLNVAALKQRYQIDPQTPRRLTGTINVPVDVTPEQLREIAAKGTQRFIEAMVKDGWQFRSDQPVTFTPGRYPAPDLKSGLMMPDRREYLVRAVFTRREQNTVRVELDPKVLEPTPTTSKVDETNLATSLRPALG